MAISRKNGDRCKLLQLSRDHLDDLVAELERLERSYPFRANVGDALLYSAASALPFAFIAVTKPSTAIALVRRSTGSGGATTVVNMW